MKKYSMGVILVLLAGICIVDVAAESCQEHCKAGYDWACKDKLGTGVVFETVGTECHYDMYQTLVGNKQGGCEAEGKYCTCYKIDICIKGKECGRKGCVPSEEGTGETGGEEKKAEKETEPKGADDPECDERCRKPSNGGFGGGQCRPETAPGYECNAAGKCIEYVQKRFYLAAGSEVGAEEWWYCLPDECFCYKTYDCSKSAANQNYCITNCGSTCGATPVAAPTTTTTTTSTTSTTSGAGTGGAGGASDALAQIKDIVWGIACYVYCIVLLVVGGIVALVLIFSGIKWFTSDDESGRGEAKRRIAYAIAGLAIVVIACPMIDFLFEGTSVTEFKKCSNCDCANLPTIGGGVSGPSGKPTTGNIGVGGICEHSSDCKSGLFCSKDGECEKKKDELIPCSESMEIDGIADNVCKSGFECSPRGICGITCEHSSECKSGLFCSNKGLCEEQKESGERCAESYEIDKIANNVCESGKCTGNVCVVDPHCTKSSYCESHAKDFGFQSGESYCATVDGDVCLEKVDEERPCSDAQVKEGDANLMCKTDWCIDGICRKKDYCENHEHCDVYHTAGTYYCGIDWKCLPKKSDGKTCDASESIDNNADIICKSGNCQGVCKPATT